MIRPRPGVLALLLALSAFPAAAGPLQITGKIHHPPKDAQVELRPWAVEYAEALRRLKSETVSPIASARPLADGSFALRVPDAGFYSVLIRAEGHLILERFVPFVVEDVELPPVELPPVSPLEVKAVGADGQPLAGVTIQAVPVREESGAWRAADRSAVTDAQGRVVFLRAEGEALELVVTTPGRFATASTSSTGSSQTVRFQEWPSCAVEFRDPAGRPAAGALVRFARRGWMYGLTGEDGRIALPAPDEEEIDLFAEDARGLRTEISMSGKTASSAVIPAVILRPPETVSGRVLEASSREPIPGALVWTGGPNWARTGAGGTWELPLPSGDPRRIEATAAGHMLHFQGPGATVTFLLEAAAAISGQVVDEEGRPVAGAQVTTLLNPEEDRSMAQEERSSASGPDGRFLLRHLPAGRLHAVEAAREGFAPARRLADSTAPVRLVLRRGALATGRVVDEEGLPVAGARVSLTAESEPDAPSRLRPFQATADADGRFRLSAVSAGRFSLRAESPGFAATEIEGIFIPEQEARADLGEVRLPPGGAIEGIVTDSHGRPVAGAWVDVSPSGSEDFTAVAAALSDRPHIETGADGRFRVGELPRGAHLDLEVEASGLQPAEVPGVEVPTAQPLRIRLDSPRTLAGRVVDDRGGPVAGARVAASRTTELPGMSTTRVSQAVATDPEGLFVLSSLSPGPVDLQVDAARYRSREVPVEVPEEGEADPVEIVLEPGTWLEGLVLDSQGRPVHRARLQVHSPLVHRGLFSGGETDEEGRYEIGDLEPGTCEVLASSFEGSRFTQATLEIRPGRNRLELRFPAGVEVSGRVLDSRGEPLPGAGLTLSPLEPGPEGRFLQEHRGRTSADGSFVLTDVADGEYQLTAARPGFAPSSHPGGLRVEGAPVGGLELRLAAGAVIRGRILGLRPEEARGAMVTAYAGPHDVAGVPVGTGFAYRIDHVAPGEWKVVARIPPDLSIEGAVEVPEGAEEVVLDLEVPSGFTLNGRVALDREPLAGAEVAVASPASSFRRAATTGRDGAFRLEHLPGGTYLLSVTVLPESLHFQPLEIGGHAGDTDIAVEIATGALEGRVLLPEGLPAAGATVSLAHEIPGLQISVFGPIVTADDQGAFTVRVPAGTWRLFFQAQGFAEVEKSAVVTPGGTVHMDVALGVLRR